MKHLTKLLASLLFYTFISALTVLAQAQAQGDPFAAALAEARTLINEGNPAAAVAKLRALPSSGDVRIAQLLGVAYYHTNDHPHAIELLTPIIDKLPPDSLQQREAVQV